MTEPTCCPEAYICQGETECPRHGGFDICCDRLDLHVPQSREAWHEQMADYERSLLDTYITEFLAESRTRREIAAEPRRLPAVV